MHKSLSIRSLQQRGALSAVDVHLAELAARLTNDDSDECTLAMALASQWPQRGHVCLDLQRLKAEQLWETQEEIPETPEAILPAPASWIESLRASPAIGSPESLTPFVLWKDQWLYLRRYWDYEREVAERVAAWLEQEPNISDNGRAEEITAHLFDRVSIDPGDRQQEAVLRAATSPCFILTGGPGTGKTTTVLRILALLLNLNPGLEIALAAPTGKAALRLQESIAQNLESLPCDETVKANMPTSAQTLHRLLGHQRHKTTFRHHESRPLNHDLVVVDEASMMDLGLLAKLLRALRPEARLLLIGDRQQLPSVDAGAVFGSLCGPDSPVPRVELTKNYRFSQNTGIGALAKAIREGDAAEAERLLTADEDPQCRLDPLPPPNRLQDALWLTLEDHLNVLASVREPEEAFAHLDKLRVLCAHRTGPFGSIALNELVHDLLVTHMRLNRQSRWFPGRPILITENDYAVELFNGDTGVILPWQGKLHAFFRSGDGGFRHVPAARLPAHEPAYAMTVHKSQGSEFDTVHLILTDQPSRVLTRELLYTGVTRARAQLRIWSPPLSLRACIGKPLERTSGLPVWFESWKNPEPSA